jgi:hypothetical protein
MIEQYLHWQSFAAKMPATVNISLLGLASLGGKAQIGLLLIMLHCPRCQGKFSRCRYYGHCCQFKLAYTLLVCCQCYPQQWWFGQISWSVCPWKEWSYAQLILIFVGETKSLPQRVEPGVQILGLAKNIRQGQAREHLLKEKPHYG